MDQEAEIRDLKAALAEIKFGAAGLAVCIAQTLAASDPTFQKRLASTLRDWFGRLESRQQPDAREIALMFGRAFADQAFPLSSEPPKE